jgi:hypothetical protein
VGPYPEQISRRPIKKNVSRKEHIYNGWPHFGPTHCMCLDECCHSWEYGCICRICPCQKGIDHDPATLAQIREALDRLCPITKAERKTASSAATKKNVNATRVNIAAPKTTRNASRTTRKSKGTGDEHRTKKS